MADAPILDDDAPSYFPSEPTLRGRTSPHGNRIQAGEVLLGRYTVLSELGEGGMGVVYRCFDSIGGIEVALKCLPPELSRNEAEMQGIRDNYAIVARLHHSAISGLRQLERDPEFGDYYLMMDLAEGEDLSALLRRRHGAPMPLAEALAILRPLASALDYAHGEKVLHRDVKPANVKVRPAAEPGGSPRVQLLDFGLAAEVRSSMSRVSLRGHLGASGTPSYMAPEQWEARRQGPATDQYALAVVAYQMLSGYLPFEASDPDILRRAVLSRPPDPIPGLSMTVNAAILRALAKDPASRFPSCAAFVKALAGGAGRPGKPFRLVVPSSRSDEPFRRANPSSRPAGTLRQAASPRPAADRHRPILPWMAVMAAAAAVCAVFVQRSRNPMVRPAAEPPSGRPEWNPEIPAIRNSDDTGAKRDDQASIASMAPSSERRGPKPGKKGGDVLPLTVAGVSFNLCWCPPGTFTMGSPPDESDASDEERPQASVTVRDGFWMGETEVTELLWQRIMGGNILHGGLYPVRASWSGCKEFVEKLNAHPDAKMAGLRFAMPTEAQWEYACRAKGREEKLDATGWYSGNSGGWLKPVRGKDPNAWGLYDMRGNVREWCANVWQDHPDDSLENEAAVQAQGALRVMRGGSYKDSERNCRSASRFENVPNYGNEFTGFRLMLLPDGR